MIDVNWNLAPEGAEELVQFESHVTWRKGIKIWCMVQQGWRDYVSDFKVIATRPTQTKTVADAVEQEGEKWTHELDDGDRCKVIYEGKKKTWVLTEYTQDKLVKNDSLKPIKPTISKAEAWDKLIQSGINPLNITDEYEVI